MCVEPTDANPEVTLRCKVSLCNSVVNGLEDFKGHLREHLTTGDSVQCPFQNCDRQFHKKS